MILDKVLDFLFPPICGICSKNSKEWICENCLKIIVRNNYANTLIRNNKNTNLYKVGYNDILYNKNEEANSNNNTNNQYIYYIFDYKNTIRKKLIDFKFNDKSYLYSFFSNIILKNKKICQILKSYDIIITVPMTKAKKKIRGYNQVELIAKEIGKRLDIETNCNILQKTKDNRMQSTLSYSERKENVKNIYKVNMKYKEKITNKKIILFDDIYTTGFTINECIKEIKKLKPNKIDGLVISKGKIER